MARISAIYHVYYTGVIIGDNYLAIWEEAGYIEEVEAMVQCH